MGDLVPRCTDLQAHPTLAKRAQHMTKNRSWHACPEVLRATSGAWLTNTFAAVLATSRSRSLRSSAVRHEARDGTAPFSELFARARRAFDLGEHALNPSESPAQEGGAGLACDLFRQSLHWALLAHGELRAANPEPSGEPRASAGLPWEHADPVLLAQAAGGAPALDALKTELSNATFVDFAERPPSEQRRLAERLARFVDGLLAPLEPPLRALERVWVRRAVRAIAVVVALIAVVALRQGYEFWRASGTDYAKGARWTTSSVAPFGGCESPAQDCAENQGYFFHTTAEQNPFILFDLRSTRRISRVWVENRRDCCAERAVPLVVLAGTRKDDLHEVARRTAEFSTWRERFPELRARYVKLMIDGNTSLHLSSVRILP